MLLIFALLAVGSTVLAWGSGSSSRQDNPIHKFGCSYKNDHYEMDTVSGSRSPHTPQYSDLSERVTEKLEFKDTEELIKFKIKVDTIMTKEHSRFPFNAVDPYIDLFNKFFNPSNRMNEFDQFYSSFVPTYPPSGEDSITALLRVYEKLVKFDSRVEKSFILGTIDLDVGMTYSNFLRQYVREGRDAHIPPPSFQHDGIVGVIPFSVAGDSGVLLLDLQDFKAFTPRIMNDFSHTLTTKIVGYELRPNYKAVFEYSSGMDYIGINHYKATSSSRRSNNVKERTDILYIGRSLCSFVQTTQKAKLLEPIRIIGKFSRSGILQAYVKSSIEDCTAILYTDSPIANDYDYTSVAIPADKEIGFYIKLELVELYKDTLSKNQEKFIRDVGNRLELTQGKKRGVNQAKSRGGTLRDRLKELAKICGVAPNFNKDVHKKYLKIYGNVSQVDWMN